MHRCALLSVIYMIPYLMMEGIRILYLALKLVDLKMLTLMSSRTKNVLNDGLKQEYDELYRQC